MKSLGRLFLIIQFHRGYKQTGGTRPPFLWVVVNRDREILDAIENISIGVFLPESN